MEGVIKKLKSLFLKIQVFFKKMSVKNDIDNIKTIYDKLCDDKEKIKHSEKKKAKKQFDLCKENYFEFVQFCESNHVEVEQKILEVKEIIEDTEDAFECKTLLDWQLKKATRAYNAMYESVNEKGELLYEIRSNCVSLIEHVEKLINSISKYPKEFDSEFEEIKIKKDQFKSVCEFGLEQLKSLEKTAAGSGAGVAMGAAVASMAPSAAMWVATTFGTASTGTAISALSGAAATNAALAWLGGGALAAGGSGMAAGQALLLLAGPVGWGLAGASVGAGALLFFRSKLKREEDKKNEIIKLKNSTAALKEMRLKISDLELKTQGLYKNLEDQISRADCLFGEDYESFDDEYKSLLGTIVNNTKSLSVLINEVVGE